MKILFLDFDGVLHSESNLKKPFFENNQYLEQFLSEFPDLKIVLYTTWLLEHSIEKLKTFFPKNIQEKIVDGLIPKEFYDNAGNIEIKNYLLKYNEEINYIILNDKKHLFIKNMEKVFICSPSEGLDDFSLMGLVWKAKSLNL